MVEAQNSVIDGRHIRIEQARVNRTLLLLRLGRTTTEQVFSHADALYISVSDVFYSLHGANEKRECA